MHAVTIVVECTVEASLAGPQNPMEIFDARFFPAHELPGPLAFTLWDMLGHALSGADPTWE